MKRSVGRTPPVTTDGPHVAAAVEQLGMVLAEIAASNPASEQDTDSRDDLETGGRSLAIDDGAGNRDDQGKN